MVQIGLFYPQQYSSSVAERSKEQEFNNPTLRMSEVQDVKDKFSSLYNKDQNDNHVNNDEKTIRAVNMLQKSTQNHFIQYLLVI